MSLWISPSTMCSVAKSTLLRHNGARRFTRASHAYLKILATSSMTQLLVGHIPKAVASCAELESLSRDSRARTSADKTHIRADLQTFLVNYPKLFVSEQLHVESPKSHHEKKWKENVKNK